MPSRRQERVSHRILREAADRLRDIKDPRLGFVTLAGCEVSPDLRHAKIRVSVLGPEEARDLSLAILRRHAGPMRGAIARALSLRVAPELDFAPDTSAEEAALMSRLIREARAGDPNPGPLSPEEERRFREAAAAARGDGLPPAASRLLRGAGDKAKKAAGAGGIELVPGPSAAPAPAARVPDATDGAAGGGGREGDGLDGLDDDDMDFGFLDEDEDDENAEADSLEGGEDEDLLG